MSDQPPRDPMRAAQAAMRPSAARRFYKQAHVGEAEGGFALLLDGRGARTPARRRIVVPSRALAELLASEWAAQSDLLEPAAMPATRLVNSALDGVAGALDETAVEIARYAGYDLLCYRAEAPEALVAAQAAAFDPVLDWAREALGARFVLAAGLMPVAQPEPALAAVRAAIVPFRDPIALAALHVMTSLTGSALLALGVARGRLSAEEAWRTAHVDEDFQIASWGEDDEAAARRALRWRDMQAAAETLAALRRG